MLYFKSPSIYCIPVWKVVEGRYRMMKKKNKLGFAPQAALMFKAGKEAEPTKKTEEIDHRWRKYYCESRIITKSQKWQIRSSVAEKSVETHYLCGQGKKVKRKS